MNTLLAAAAVDRGGRSMGTLWKIALRLPLSITTIVAKRPTFWSINFLVDAYGYEPTAVELFPQRLERRTL